MKNFFQTWISKAWSGTYSKVLIWTLLLIGLQLISVVKAQILYPENRHFSTFDWTTNLRLQILDKSHAYGDLLYDRGFSRVLTPLTKHEYELDMMNQEFYPGDQYQWNQGELNGLRSRFSSYDKGRFAVFTELHVDTELSKNAVLGLNTYLQQHARANRALFEFAYKRKITENHSIYIQQTIAEYKKDVDATLSYRYRNVKFGHFRFDITYQDYLNNIVNDVGNDPYFQTREESSINLQEDVLSPNIMMLGRWMSSGTKPFHWDLSFIVQPKVEKEIFGEPRSTFSVKTKESIYVLNGLIDLNLGPLTIGLFGYKTINNERRNGFTDSTNVDYNTRQVNTKVGFIATGSWWKVTPLFRISREHYNDTQAGNNGGISVVDKEFNFEENRWMLDAGLLYRINDAISVMSRYQSQLRTTDEDEVRRLYDADVIENMVRNWSQFYINTGRRLDNRISLHIIMQLHSKVRFQLFGAFDLDADTNRYNDRIQRFDKGGAKMIIALD